MTTKVRAWLLGGTMAAALLMSPALAQPSEPDNVTARLIELLVKKGVLPRDEANALLQEAQAEKTRSKKPKKETAVATPDKARATSDKGPPEETVPSGTVRVTYVPQIVRTPFPFFF